MEGTDEIYPNVANPMRELVSCGVEIILDKLVMADDKYPAVPKPITVELS